MIFSATSSFSASRPQGRKRKTRELDASGDVCGCECCSSVQTTCSRPDSRPQHRSIEQRLETARRCTPQPPPPAPGSQFPLPHPLHFCICEQPGTAFTPLLPAWPLPPAWLSLSLSTRTLLLARVKTDGTWRFRNVDSFPDSNVELQVCAAPPLWQLKKRIVHFFFSFSFFCFDFS